MDREIQIYNRMNEIQRKAMNERYQAMFGMGVQEVNDYYEKGFLGGAKSMRAGSILSDTQQVLEFAEEAIKAGNEDKALAELERARQWINIAKYGIFDYWSGYEQAERKEG